MTPPNTPLPLPADLQLPDPWAPFERACARAKLTLKDVADKLGIQRQALTGWRNKSKRLGRLWVPSERVLELERILTPHLTKERMRPDLYKRARR